MILLSCNMGAYQVECISPLIGENISVARFTRDMINQSYILHICTRSQHSLFITFPLYISEIGGFR